ncbi:MAG: 23S rRNA (guanosine(2251)-2'-O)-methyltransferase RlmB [Treponema sp.]|nr:23S rRNA (guanosine(2251)-2'-O)-methyltransferase RlmB [Treponema sp.]
MIITGFHSIEEKIRAVSSLGGAGVFKLYYSKAGPRVKKILAAASQAGIKAEQVADSKLDEMVSSLEEALRNHRGIVMSAEGGKKSTENILDFDTWLKLARNKDSEEKQTVVILDCVTDPHNVGAILRSCDQFGIDLVIIPENKSVSDISGNEVVARSSAGANAWVKCCIVNNLVRAAEKLKDAGFWIYGADAGGKSCRQIEFPAKTALIMGSEGTGIAELLEKKCDQIVSIPTCGKIDSLNVSVAAGILLYEISSRHK